MSSYLVICGRVAPYNASPMNPNQGNRCNDERHKNWRIIFEAVKWRKKMNKFTVRINKLRNKHSKPENRTPSMPSLKKLCALSNPAYIPMSFCIQRRRHVPVYKCHFKFWNNWKQPKKTTDTPNASYWTNHSPIRRTTNIFILFYQFFPFNNEKPTDRKEQWNPRKHLFENRLNNLKSEYLALC